MIDFVSLNEALVDPKRWNAALQELYALLERSPILTGLDGAVAKDLCQATVLAMWQRAKNGNPIPNASYVYRSLANRRIDFFRRRQLQLQRETEAFEATQQAEQPSPEGALTATDVRAAFERLLTRAVADRKPHLQDKLRRDCEQVWDLALGVRDMNVEIAAELASATGSETHETIQDRLLQRHRQARLSLDAALATLLASGEIAREHREFHEMLLRKLLRRQNGRRAASKR